jgi:hypothetical protein
VVSVDSTEARAHQNAAGARKSLTGARANHRTRRPEPEDQALGRSPGGWSTKTHLSVDRRGRPLSVRLTASQAGDNPQLLPLIARGATRSPTAPAGAAAVTGDCASMPSCTGTVTSSSEPSTASRAGEASPPAMTNTPASTGPASSSPASSSSGHPQRPRTVTLTPTRTRRRVWATRANASCGYCQPALRAVSSIAASRLSKVVLSILSITGPVSRPSGPPFGTYR